jgi:Fe-S-cluster containining protein
VSEHTTFFNSQGLLVSDFFLPPIKLINMSKYTNYTHKGECTRCGHCCTDVGLPMTKQEVMEIVHYIQVHKIRPVNRKWIQELKKNKSAEGLILDIRCCFYDPINFRCLIYEVRPSICKKFKCSQQEKTIEKNKLKHHKIADFNHSDETYRIKNLTNFDLLIYGEIIPLQVILSRKWTDTNLGTTDEQIINYLSTHCCKLSYKLKY